MSFRIGVGYDLHRTESGDSIILGGVRIDAPFRLAGHSDADVLLHAITDALLGAIAEQDIGHFFPPNKDENKDRDSRDFLAFALDKVKSHGYQVANIDSVIICEQPKIGPVREAIRQKVAVLLQVDVDCVGIKATTNEGVDAIGRGEAVAAHAVVLLEATK